MSRCPCRDCKKEACYRACGKLVGWRKEPPLVYLRDRETEQRKGLW